MKIQDIGFFIVLLAVVFLRRRKLAVVAGLLCLLFSIPLFATWVFFTAQRLTYYAAAFFLYAIMSSILNLKSS
jgi:hypothetical protein